MYLVKWTDGPGKVFTIDTNLHTLVIPREDVQMAPTVLKPSNFFFKCTLFWIEPYIFHKSGLG